MIETETPTDPLDIALENFSDAVDKFIQQTTEVEDDEQG